MPKIVDEIGMASDDVNFNIEDIQMLVEDYTSEAGVRKLKEILFDLVRECNRQEVNGQMKLPCDLDTEAIRKLLKRKHPIIHEKIHKSPRIGVMNGMYASSNGLGGITKIEVSRTNSKHPFDLQLTGSQGDVMKESMKCALTVAWNKLSEEEKKGLTKNTFGFHIHCPSCAMPKDGPSAGGAITLAILSALRNAPIKNNVAMTGEIDLNGNITQIGGLAEKVLGCKKAGVNKIFVPFENTRDLEDIKEEFPNLFDDKFQYKIIQHLDEAIPEVF